MIVIWVDIWDSQSSSKTKILINKCFNFGSHIVTIYSINMKSGVPQCKNCWKWEHTTFACQAHSTKYLKCNGPYKLEHHKNMAWCYKPNFKTNLPKLETSRNESCLHMFKYTNCKGDYQANSYNYPF